MLLYKSKFCFVCRLAYFKAAYALFDAEFYVKADDDIYLRPGEYIENLQYVSKFSFKEFFFFFFWHSFN